MINNLKYFSIGILKDALKVVSGLIIYSHDISKTGYFFAIMGVFQMLSSFSSNIDGENLLEKKGKNSVSFLEFYAFILIILISIFIQSELTIIILFFSLLNFGEVYFRTYLIENRYFNTLNKKKFFEIIIILGILFFYDKIPIEWALLAYISSSGMSSFLFKKRYKLIANKIKYIFSINNLTALYKFRSLSLIVKSAIGFLDVYLISNVMDYQSSGSYKLIKSLGISVNMISNLYLEKIRSKYIKNINLKSHVIFKYLLFLSLTGFFLGSIICIISRFDLLLNLLRINSDFPILGKEFVLFTSLLGMAGLYRIYYLYKNKMMWNFISQVTVILIFLIFVFFENNDIYIYLIVPQIISLSYFIGHRYVK